MLHDSLNDSLDIEVEDTRCENIAEKDVGLAEAQIHETNMDNLTTISSRPLKKDHNVYADAGPVSFPSLQNPELHLKTIHGTFDDPSLDCGTNHDGQYSQMRMDTRRENDWRTVASSCQRSTSHRARQVCRHF
ncbi:hypothetical protein OIU79_009388 [Salix purpurea]|uniref:Uncharacterized protein n=1 Tax=Salix purpurea TaxID=77065 RepID=A0A9Q0TKJ0_SALPP|nr:hypothetical protein OIU79_009388 [Salix purpurea]